MNPVRTTLIVAFLLLAPALYAQDDYESWRRQQEQDYQQFKSDLEAEWQAWVRADSLAFAAFRQEIEGKWGEVKPTTKKDWVEYAEDKESLSAVDFEKGEAVVAVLVEEDAAEPESASLARLEQAVQQLVVDRGKTMDYPVAGEQPEPLRDQPVLENQLADAAGEPVTQANAAEFAHEVVQPAAVRRVPVESKDGVQRIKLEVSIPLVPRHLRVRAERFLDDVNTYAERYELDTRLVMAVMHTESYFNPKAKSHVPAFGLLQLVPRYGAKDAYEFVYHEEKLLTPNYLYRPTNNVELGCAYLHLVMTRYLKRIENPDSRLYCAIAAYNTGAGNVSRAFTGDRKINAAARVINTMEPQDVLAKLKKDLPYQETRDYIIRVLDRMKFYEEWKN